VSSATHPARHPAVVVALDCITGLQTARILAARGIQVTGVAADPRHYCSRTRAVRRVVASPTAGEPLIATLERIGPQVGDPAQGGPAFLVPCSDTSVLSISAARERLLPWFRFVLPPHEVVERLVDKIGFTELAQANGLAIPPTRVLRSRADAETAAAALAYPVVLKPGVKTARWQAATKAKVFRVDDAAGLLETYDRCAAWTDSLIAQTWIDGAETDLYTSNLYFDRASQPQVTFITRKLRQWPIETGTGCLGVEARNDAVLEESIRFFRSVDYQGLGYLELKRDARTGDHYIIEPNIGRPTGRSATAERAGVELLMTAYHDAFEEPLPSARTQRYEGVKWIYWRRDLQSSLVAARHGQLSPLGWWRSIRGPRVEAVGSWRDPLPFVLDAWRIAVRIGRRMRPGRPSRPTAPDAARGKA
jgi:D-aspartate ligase